MSKKKIITLKEDRPNLADDFSLYLNSSKTTYWDGFYDDWDSEDDYYWNYFYNTNGGCSATYPKEENDDDEYENYWNRKAEKEKDIKQATDADIDEIIHERKAIYFYDDIEDKSSVHKFKNLKKFFNFLDEKGIDISDNEGSKFIRANERHCCIDPLIYATMNKKEIVSDNSYGALVYETLGVYY